MVKYIEFLISGLGFDVGDHRRVVIEDDAYYYYYDLYNRWCSVPKTDQGITFLIKERKR